MPESDDSVSNPPVGLKKGSEIVLDNAALHDSSWWIREDEDDGALGKSIADYLTSRRPSLCAHAHGCACKRHSPAESAGA